MPYRSFRTPAARGALILHGRCTRGAHLARPPRAGRSSCTVVADSLSFRTVIAGDFAFDPLHKGSSARFARKCHVEQENPAHPAGVLHDFAQDARPWQISVARTLQNEFPKARSPFGLRQPCVLSSGKQAGTRVGKQPGRNGFREDRATRNAGNESEGKPGDADGAMQAAHSGDTSPPKIQKAPSTAGPKALPAFGCNRCATS